MSQMSHFDKSLINSSLISVSRLNEVEEEEEGQD